MSFNSQRYNMLYCSSEWKWKTGEHLQARKGDFDLDWYLARANTWWWAWHDKHRGLSLRRKLTHCEQSLNMHKGSCLKYQKNINMNDKFECVWHKSQRFPTPSARWARGLRRHYTEANIKRKSRIVNDFRACNNLLLFRLNKIIKEQQAKSKNKNPLLMWLSIPENVVYPTKAPQVNLKKGWKIKALLCQKAPVSSAEAKTSN